MDEQYDNFIGIEVELDNEENPKKKKKNKSDFIEIDAIERTIEFIEKEETEAQTKPRRSTTGRGFTLINNAPAPFDPSKILNLSLWLKADAGVTLATSGPYTYVSQIVITGSNTPNVNGTYNATSVPTFDFEGMPNPYFLSGPTYTIEWTNPTFYLDVSGIGAGASWTSSDGTSWTILESRPDTITISGSTTPNVNGVYTRPIDENVFYGPTTNVIENYGNFELLDQATSTIYYTASSATGPWTIVDGTGAITSTITSVPRGTITATKVVSSSAVTAWADQSGNNRNASEYSGSYPTYSLIGGKSFINFNAFVDLILSNPIWEVGYTYIGTIFTVARFPSSSEGGNARLFSAEANTNYFIFGRGIDSTNAFFVTNNQEDYATSSLEASNNTNYILEATFDEDDATIYLNGIQSGASGISSNFATGNEAIGGGEEPSSIAEMVVYNRVLTTEERQQVEQYLNSKYQIYPWRVTISGAGTTTSNGEYVWDGVTLDSGKPTYTNPSGNYIYWDDTWYIYDATTESATYLISSSDFSGAWVENDGSLPVPTSTLSYTP